jgi:O-antigen ligase
VKGFDSPLLGLGRSGFSLRVNDPRLVAVHLMDLPLYAFVASIPFESIGASGQGVEAVPGTISKALGITWAVFCLINPNVPLRWMHRTIIAVAMFLGILCTRTLLIDPALLPDAAEYLLMLAQLIAMSWLVINVISNRPKLYETIAWVYAVSCVVLGLLQVLGLTTTELEGGRVTAFGEDPNIMCGKLAVGLVLMIGLTWGRAGTGVWKMLFGLLTCPVMVISILGSGSRGGMVAMLAGLGVLLWPVFMARGGIARILRATLLLAGLFGIFYGISTASVLTDRWNLVIDGRDFAKRQLLYPEALDMLVRKPLTGWGPIQNYQELAERMHDNEATQSTENTFLWALTSVGILGSLPFFYFIYYAVRSSWRARKTFLGWTPIAALVTILISGCTVEWQHNKVFWLALSMSTAIGSAMLRSVNRRPASGASLLSTNVNTGSILDPAIPI